MTWTYDGAPGTSSATERRDAVRLLIGDTDTNNQQVTDEEITFYLAQANDDVYSAAALAARGLVGLYANKADTSFESVRIQYSQLSERFHKLAQKLEASAKKYGSVALGVPKVGGISESEMESVRDDTDRVRPSFRRDQFRNPPNTDEDDHRYGH